MSPKSHSGGCKMMGGSYALDLGVLLGAAVLAVLVSSPEVLGVEEPPAVLVVLVSSPKVLGMEEPPVQPKVKITPTEDDSSSHNTLLICTMAGFFPPKIEIKWFRNGKEETRVWTTDVTRNGDWTFQIQVMLEAQPERGDIYACQVDHTSFEGPITMQWDPQSDSAKSKMWTGIVGMVLGLVFVATGLTLYLKKKKGDEGGRKWESFILYTTVVP
ncbi:SMH class II histocompatibility antigen, beta-1 chain-like [Rhineura floridana]|uniref:SMH class II histocompatibility antigen, beta-1 chain-like n=1 Tax=Rhineura floridana TaxID=261503 RepID=UPI002AC85E40|nr:SMH class II histocompatibility antigen, beta-1 chain-like [Rhineura floridana]